MKLGDLMARLEQIECQAAVYDELVVFLDKVIEGGEDHEIPMASGDGVVPTKHVAEVRDQLKQKGEELGELLGAAEDVEVGDVELDLGGG